MLHTSCQVGSGGDNVFGAQRGNCFAAHTSVPALPATFPPIPGKRIVPLAGGAHSIERKHSESDAKQTLLG